MVNSHPITLFLTVNSHPIALFLMLDSHPMALFLISTHRLFLMVNSHPIALSYIDSHPIVLFHGLFSLMANSHPMGQLLIALFLIVNPPYRSFLSHAVFLMVNSHLIFFSCSFELSCSTLFPHRSFSHSELSPHCSFLW